MNLSLSAERPRVILPHHSRADIWLRADMWFNIRSRSVSAALNPERRVRCELDLLAFLNEYLPHRFYRPSEAHLKLVARLQSAILFRGLTPQKHADAEPRSFGKSTIERAAALWACLYRHRRFALLIGETAPKGQALLAQIKNEITTNEAIAEDFPEVVRPIKEFNGDPKRAPPDFPWATDRARLPNGVWIHGRGIDSSMAGLNELGVRPDLIFGDDVESVSSVRSETETAAIEERWRKEVCRLHDINYPASYFWLCTIRSRSSISARLTDPKVEPEWRGQRFAALTKAPERGDLWEKYMDCCRGATVEVDLAEPAAAWTALNSNEEDFTKLTQGHQKALRFYILNREVMDAGGETLDPIRLPFHMLYHARATEGEEVFRCELQNDPPEDANVTDRQLDVDYLMKRRIEVRSRIVPSWAARVLCSIDIGVYRCYWEASAWSADGTTSQLIECGIQETNVDAGGRYKMTDAAATRQMMVLEGIQHALTTLRLKFAEGWPRVGGGAALADLTGVDCGGTAEDLAWHETIMKHCADSGLKWIPLKGEKWTESIATRALGRNWICEAERNPGRRIDCNVNEYKLRLVRAYEAPATNADGTPFRGARVLNYDTPQEYCLQQTAERYVATFNEAREIGKAESVGWFAVPALRRRNHWFDTAWMQFALSDIAVCLNLQTSANATPAPTIQGPRMPAVPPEFRRERF